MTPGQIACFEPFYGGSHRQFADGLVEHSRHQVTLFTCPDRFWKWRTRGAALAFFEQLPDPRAFDVIVASDMVNLAELQGLWKVPVRSVLYMHENQLTYPLQAGQQRDANHVMTDLLSAVSANLVVFNSFSHRQDFIDAARRFLGRMPDERPGWVIPALEARSVVRYPGVSLGAPWPHREPVGEGPVIVWPHRWEWDKGPDEFADVLFDLCAQGVPFRLVLLGDRAGDECEALLRIVSAFSDRILFCGHAVGEEYARWLSAGDIVVSTALQETFGIACVEAMYAGCLPLVPDRLSYREIVPPELMGSCVYRDAADLCARVAAFVPDAQTRRIVHEWAATFAWPSRIGAIDDLLSSV